eukprot:CAMPEP_0171068134 /NCGR_PEP_ID=MMETSP0766_2-20121228/8395_1 /TAXON_ID=439317 /ORGANISM="Gambierdiscus australes, Strain CAWD 149" /LENGTH=57 /DNA_ID=CAMNT_0011524419 /DNA_START=205 /DNA_END=375 /DNA_ORIENTATION=-
MRHVCGDMHLQKEYDVDLPDGAALKTGRLEAHSTSMKAGACKSLLPSENIPDPPRLV